MPSSAAYRTDAGSREFEIELDTSRGMPSALRICPSPSTPRGRQGSFSGLLPDASQCVSTAPPHTNMAPSAVTAQVCFAPAATMLMRSLPRARTSRGRSHGSSEGSTSTSVDDDDDDVDDDVRLFSAARCVAVDAAFCSFHVKCGRRDGAGVCSKSAEWLAQPPLPPMYRAYCRKSPPRNAAILATATILRSIRHSSRLRRGHDISILPSPSWLSLPRPQGKASIGPQPGCAPPQLRHPLCESP